MKPLFSKLLGGLAQRSCQRGREPITCHKDTITKHTAMVNFPLFKGIVNKTLAVIDVVEAAAQWPPIRLGLELDADTKHSCSCFRCTAIPLPGGFRTTKNPRFSWLLNLSVKLKESAILPIAHEEQRDFADSTTFAGFLKVSAIDAKNFIVHFWPPFVNLACTARATIKSWSSAWIVPP